MWGEAACLRFVCDTFALKAGHFYGRQPAVPGLSTRMGGGALACARYVSDVALSLRAGLFEHSLVRWIVAPLIHPDAATRAEHAARLKGLHGGAAGGGGGGALARRRDPHALGHVEAKREAMVATVLEREIFPALGALLTRGERGAATKQLVEGEGGGGGGGEGEGEGGAPPRFLNGDFPGIADFSLHAILVFASVAIARADAHSDKILELFEQRDGAPRVRGRSGGRAAAEKTAAAAPLAPLLALGDYQACDGWAYRDRVVERYVGAVSAWLREGTADALQETVDTVDGFVDPVAAASPALTRKRAAPRMIRRGSVISSMVTVGPLSL